MKINIFISLIIILSVVSCKKDEPEAGKDEVKKINLEHGIITIGKPVKMSGPEFLKMLEKQNKNTPKETDKTNLTVTLLGNIKPIERIKRFEASLQRALGELAEISGGGSYIEAGKIISCDIEIDLKKENLDKVLKIIKSTLKKLEAPKGATIIQYDPEKVAHKLYEE